MFSTLYQAIEQILGLLKRPIPATFQEYNKEVSKYKTMLQQNQMICNILIHHQNSPAAYVYTDQGIILFRHLVSGILLAIRKNLMCYKIRIL